MRFQLVRYFTIASLAMFVLVAVVLTHFQREEASFFQDVQEQQIRFFTTVQQDFARQQDQAALRDLLAIHESGNVNLTRLLSNALWEKDFAPFVGKAQVIGIDACRAMTAVQDKTGKPVQSAEQKACFSEVGQKISLHRNRNPAFPQILLKIAAMSSMQAWSGVCWNGSGSPESVHHYCGSPIWDPKSLLPAVALRFSRMPKCPR